MCALESVQRQARLWVLGLSDGGQREERPCSEVGAEKEANSCQRKGLTPGPRSLCAHYREEATFGPSASRQPWVLNPQPPKDRSPCSTSTAPSYIMAEPLAHLPPCRGEWHFCSLRQKSWRDRCLLSLWVRPCSFILHLVSPTCFFLSHLLVPLIYHAAALGWFSLHQPPLHLDHQVVHHITLSTTLPCSKASLSL